MRISRLFNLIKMGDTPISGWAALAVVIAVIVIFVKIGSAGNDGNDHPSSAHDESVMAFEQCKDFVKERLKAPGTADFGEYWGSHVKQVTDPGAKLEDVTYQVVSYVDAQNSFGASCVISLLAPKGGMGRMTPT